MDNILKNSAYNLIGSANKPFFTDYSNLNVTNLYYNIVLDVIEEIKKPWFAENFLRTHEQTQNVGFLITKNSEFCVCHFSNMIDDKMNMLLFIYKGCFFYIMQYVSSVDFIYFPQVNLAHRICHFTDEMIQESLLKFNKVLKATPNSELNSNKKLEGIVSSNNSPYHFFYDTSLMMEYLNNENLLENKKNYQIEGADFFDFSKIYRVKNIVTTYEKINKLSKDNNTIFFKIGLNYGYGVGQPILDGLAKSFDSKVILFTRKNVINGSVLKRVKNHKENGSFVLWFGVTTNKRALIEQIDIALALTKELSKYYNVCLLIDGLTSPNTRQGNIDSKTLSDYRVFEEIRSRASGISTSLIDTISLIDLRPIDKLAISDLINFYVSNSGTGSIWLSRFSGKLGISHISNEFFPQIVRQHIHNGSDFYPLEYVEDIKTTGQRMDFVSYSIEPNSFLKYFTNNYSNLFEKNFCNFDKFKIDAFNNLDVISILENSYQAKNKDPQIMISFRTELSLKYPFCLKFVSFIDFDLDVNNLHSKLYLDYGEGFNETDSITINLDDSYSGKVIKDIRITKPIYNIRFDPINNNCKLSFNGAFYQINSYKE